MIAGLCALLGSEEENMFVIHENYWIRHQNARCVPWKSCCLRSTTGGMRCVYCIVGFILGSLEGASKFIYISLSSSNMSS